MCPLVTNSGLLTFFSIMDGFLDCSYLTDNSLDSLSIFIVISGWAVILSSCEGIFIPDIGPLLS